MQETDNKFISVLFLLFIIIIAYCNRKARTARAIGQSRKHRAQPRMGFLLKNAPLASILTIWIPILPGWLSSELNLKRARSTTAAE